MYMRSTSCMIKAERTLYLLLSKYIHITLIFIKAMRNIGLTNKQSVTSISYGLKHEWLWSLYLVIVIITCSVEDRNWYHMITCILAMLPCSSCSVHVAMILAQPISQHEAVFIIFISVLIGFRYIRASESPIHRVTGCTYGVLHGGNTIWVCRLVNQMHISGVYLTYYIVNIT